MSRRGDGVYIPDDSDFRSFQEQCESPDGWQSQFSQGGVTVWSQSPQDETCTVQKIKMRISCRDVAAETLYDMLHDIHYRPKWDSHMIDTFDIGRLTANADVGYYSWRCPSPLKNRDFVTLRSWLPLGQDYIIVNYSVKHPKHPPRKDFVRAVSLQTGYLVKASGGGGCVLYYLSQVDPRGSLPKWVVNKVSQLMAPKALKKIYKAGLKYPEWKRKHSPGYKPWLFPEQSTLPTLSLAELALQHADSLEAIDESGVAEEREQTSGGAGIRTEVLRTPRSVLYPLGIGPCWTRGGDLLLSPS
ncbi:START domain-containing protein 10-like isoform X1 [Ornithorhynchus anatinus]|uniref:START domain-containing protein 10-like isoform X1 n=1 Tax=Ornithorhynchus anatinus TaxID=9258 RepID=UPI0019D44256|nr:START domain-containing protein 10-like isoform X1 [Ornithorhynchus anatinus]